MAMEFNDETAYGRTNWDNEGSQGGELSNIPDSRWKFAGKISLFTCNNCFCREGKCFIIF